MGERSRHCYCYFYLRNFYHAVIFSRLCFFSSFIFYNYADFYVKVLWCYLKMFKEFLEGNFKWKEMEWDKLVNSLLSGFKWGTRSFFLFLELTWCRCKYWITLIEDCFNIYEICKSFRTKYFLCKALFRNDSNLWLIHP